MQKLVFPALVVSMTLGAFYLATRTEVPDEETAVKLNVSAREADEVTPWLAAAAKELGHGRVRAYDKGVFIDSDNASIAFTEAKDGMQMQVAFETKYRIPAKAREEALADLKTHGEKIFARAQELKSREAMGGAMARAEAPAGNGG
jgi:hypothetical protein